MIRLLIFCILLTGCYCKPYEKGLNKAVKDFESTRLDKTIRKLTELDACYPEKKQHHFYLGLIHYQKNEYETAIKHFLIGGFLEKQTEADWYVANAFIALNQRSKAREILKLLAEKESDFQKKAKELLSEIRD